MNLSRLDSHIKKLLLLESKLPVYSRCLLQEPWSWRGDKGDVFADLQLLARKVAAFLLGLGNLTFIVAITKQRRDIAGRIEVLRRQGEVFIEVDDELLKHPMCVPAVISHEVMHKVLHDADVWLDSEAENEELTDLACVYAGLGKLMLNGCKSSGYDSKGREHSYAVGYLSQEELAFGHAVICQMRGISSDKADAYLSKEAVQAVRYWRAQLEPLVELLNGGSALGNTVAQVIETTQTSLCETERDIRTLFRLLREALAQGAELHQRMNAAQNAIVNLKSGKAAGSDFLIGIKAIYLKEVVTAASSRDSESTLARVSRALSRKNVCRDTVDQPEIIECPIDGTKLRVPPRKVKIKVLCPKCGYKFLVSTLGEGKGKASRFFS